MKFEIQPRILLEKVAGQHVLIAYGEKRDTLPYIQAINDTAAFYWKLLEQGLSKDEIITAAVEDFDAPADRIERGFETFCQQLIELGYLKADGLADNGNTF